MIKLYVLVKHTGMTYVKNKTKFTVFLDETPYNLVQITNILKERATFILYPAIQPRSC